ncbi:AAR_G0051410.mRNA.1.CDS.1 [Saccharomyces cerevisiae]|nr:Her1p [Saccharomyces cerevisiae YJM193]AJT74080.1 Her1p [Saccharomyces cerevisiae YJM271]AJT95557.1 Her1p [Saccharomyces cerevisiae YJM1332]AJT97034.1 Her1p [Saccharomyces cerevisiae YJM1341]CAE6525098.1 Her1p [Saccharomyces cerevisiae PE-2]CAI4788525.1 AAR_G0051410.mRNA.1.CDS.1 [Saccharomyces cerevisiae]
MSSKLKYTDIDVPLDWLYKGKRRNRTKSAASTRTSEATTTSVKKTATLPSTAAVPTKTIASPQRPLSGQNVNNELSNSKPAVSAEKVSQQGQVPTRRTRSHSVSYGLLQKKNNNDDTTDSPKISRIRTAQDQPVKETKSSTLAEPIVSKKGRSRSSSISTSLNERSKKSLFGSLFGRRPSTTPSHVVERPLSSQNDHKKSTELPPIDTRQSKISTPTNTPTTASSKPSSSGGNRHSDGSLTSKLLSIPHNILETSSTNFNAHHHIQSHHSSGREQDSPHSESPDLPPILEKETTQKQLQKVSKVNLKRVTIAVQEFNSDPPQQLPSRKPKRGNVLIPEDMISAPPLISLGITNSSDQSSFQSNNSPSYSKDSKEYKLALENFKKAAKEAEKHQKDAYYVAERMAQEVANYKAKQLKTSPLTGATNSAADSATDQESSSLDARASKLHIDKPINAGAHPFETHQDDNTKYSSHLEQTLDVAYTRCCHLREILPIPSTLRQVKGKTAPLQTLKFLNPKPTLVDILSFCDFIAITPIHNIIFDNVSLTHDMFKIVICSLVTSPVVEKLGLRNVVINEQSWKLLCKFLLQNKTLIKLDISQTKARTDLNDSNYRDQMDWELFCEVLRNKEGRPLEELLLNGLRFDKMSFSHFKNILLTFAQMNPKNPIRLGMANVEFSTECFDFLFNWMSEYNVQGVDLAYNNLESLAKRMIKKLARLPYKHLEYFTLNSTNITSVDDMSYILKYLSRLPSIKFLDLSNLPQLFPGILTSGYKYFPQFPQLKRIHFDFDDLSIKETTMLVSILAKCETLSHVSLIGQSPMPDASKISDSTDEPDKSKDEKKEQIVFMRNTLWASLYAFVRDSHNLVSLDVDYDQVPDEIQSRIALCLMHNMKRIMDSSFKLDELTVQDDLIFDGSLITETAEEVLKRLNDKSLLQNDVGKKYLLKKYFEKMEKVHHNVQHTIDSMFEKRKSGELPLQEKENLLRLLLLEKNLSNILDIFASMPNIADVVPFSKADNSFPNIGDSTVSANYNDGIRPSLKHLDSDRLINDVSIPENDSSIRPHLMATDSGRIIDVTTGKALLFKSSSNTSLAGKRQEEEEGELHKWGVFVQHQSSRHNSGLPSSANSSRISGSLTPDSIVAGGKKGESSRTSGTRPKILPKIPTGAELRDAIIKAKGIDSVDDLIKNVTSEKVGLESLYGDELNSRSPSNDSLQESQQKAPLQRPLVEDETVTKKYDKLLNDLSNVRHSKT